MAKTTIRFKKNKVRSIPKASKRQKRVRLVLIGLLLLLLGNFAWDGYNKQDDLAKTYELGKQYYGIIVDEASNSFDRIKKQIDSVDNTRK